MILDTYHFAGQMVSRLKEQGRVSAPLVNVVTDYGPHMAWLAPEVDAYVVATESLRDDFVQMGAPQERIYPFGIPVFESFYREEDRAELLRGMNLSPDLPTVLIMAGSFGVKNILGVYRDISTLGTDFQVIVITGKNRKLYEAFRRELPNSPKPTHLVEFTTEVQTYMHASDLLITKPGGLTVSEALASGLPMAVFDAIPGQEEDNAQFCRRTGWGFGSRAVRAVRLRCGPFYRTHAVWRICALLAKRLTSRIVVKYPVVATETNEWEEGVNLKPKFRISLFGYGILGVAVLVLMLFEIKDGNAPMIGLDVFFAGLYRLYDL